MPIYRHECDNGHTFDLLLRFSELDEFQACECGRPASRVICAPQIFVQQDIHYTSPIDGREITSKHARIDDLRRSNCIEYDPGMKQDAERRRIDGENQLDAKVDQTMDRAIAAMPARKREKLAAEIQSGLTPEVARVA